VQEQRQFQLAVAGGGLGHACGVASAFHEFVGGATNTVVVGVRAAGRVRSASCGHIVGGVRAATRVCS